MRSENLQRSHYRLAVKQHWTCSASACMHIFGLWSSLSPRAFSREAELKDVYVTEACSGAPRAYLAEPT